MKQVLIGLCLSASVCGTALAEDPKGFEFLTYGDMPYGKSQIAFLKQAKLKIAKRDIPFALFFGDMKSGGKRCSEKRYNANLDAIFSLTNKPVYLTLGDNDWTDCDRKDDDELEKLAEIRERAYANKYLPENRTNNKITRHTEYPELVRFQYDNVYFSTLHIVGTDNGRGQILVGDKDKALNAVAARDVVNAEWLDTSFGEAASSDAFVLFIHADTTDDSRHLDKANCTVDNPEECNPFGLFLNNLKTKAKAFNKPVLLVHGSTSDYCVQNGFMDTENLTRFNGAGDGVLDMSYVRWDGESFGFSSFVTGKAVKTCEKKRPGVKTGPFS